MQIQVHPVHFEDFSGSQFERLCFAYLLRRPDYTSVNWYGQLGGDRGRDIVCVSVNKLTTIFQCANFRRLDKRKADADITKLAKGSSSKDAHFCLVAGGGVSASLKDHIFKKARSAGFSHAETWSGPEFEERLRRSAPDLLKRFTEGVAFPELPAEIAAFAADSHALTDHDILAALSIAFDRPAFRTPFHAESSLPRFQAAIVETISTLNTGITPTGKVLPSKNDLTDSNHLKAVNGLVTRLVALRASFDKFLKNGAIRHCACNEPDCHVYMVSDEAAREMDRRRSEILVGVNALIPDFDPSFYALD